MMRLRHVLLSAALFLVSSALFAQQPAPAKQQMPMAHGSEGGHQPMDCQAMMDKMHASSKAMDERLAAFVDSMNNARGSAKVDRMAAVINEMVTQRKQMRDQMAAMMPQMMNHMTQHMQSGMMSGMKSMANCPMMKGMKQTPQPSSTETPASKHKH